MSRVPGGVGPQKKFGEYLAYGTTDKPSFGNYGNIFENMNHTNVSIIRSYTDPYIEMKRAVTLYHLTP